MRIVDWRERLTAPQNRYPPAQEGPGPSVGRILGDGFLEEAWWKKPVLLDLAHPGEVDWRARMIELAATLPKERVAHVGRSGRGIGPPETLDAIDEQLLVLRDAHAEIPEVEQLRAGFCRYFRGPVSTGLYLNGPGAPGFDEHHDAHHVFAIQLVGEKTWQLAPARVRFPTRRFVHPIPQDSEMHPVTVPAGRALYLPPGVRHRAACTGEVSIHLTLGVHTPRAVDAIEALLSDAAALQWQFRAPLGAQLVGGALHWRLDRVGLEALVGLLGDQLGGWNPELPEGTPLRFAAEAEVAGQWPAADGRFTPIAAVPSVELEQARAGAQALVAELPGIEGVYARGSSLEGGDHVLDIDLLVVFADAPDAAAADRCQAVLTALAPGVDWDARPVHGDAVRRGSESTMVRMSLAARSVLLAGRPVWDVAPPVIPGRVLAVQLFQEAHADWRAVLAEVDDGDPRRTVWLQKRALRLGGIFGLARCRAFTRHPNGCVAFIDRLVPALGPAAHGVRDDLFGGAADSAAAARAVSLGEGLFAAFR